MQRTSGLMLFLFAAAATATAASVTFEKVAKIGDPVPGREGTGTVFNGRALNTYGSGALSNPSINDLGDIVFRGISSDPFDFNYNRATGLYLKRPGLPLAVIVDTTLNGVGAPKYAVPGQPADTRFSNFKAPIINNVGDILFHANYSNSSGSGQGFYVASATGGPIVKIVDSSDAVPGFSGTTFNRGFNLTSTQVDWVIASLNDAGQIVFMGMFKADSRPYDDTGMYGSTVAGGAIVRLADSTNSVAAGGETSNFLTVSQSNQPSINNSGMVLFHAGIGVNPAYPQFGVFAIPVDGSAPSTTVARSGLQTPIMSDGAHHNYYSLFDGSDINDNGDFVFQHAFQSGLPAQMALFGGNLNAGTMTTVVDNLPGGYDIPGSPGATFYTFVMATLNEHGQMGFYGDNTVSNGQGIYGTDLAGAPLKLIANNSMVPPGQDAPAIFQNFYFKCAEVNEQGNMVLAPSARNEADSDALFGLYFYDVCTQSLDRLVDTDTAPDPLPLGLGDAFAAAGCAGSPCERGIYIHQGSETRSGHYRALNNNNDIAFMSAFDTFNSGVYIARVESGAGPLSITCPDPVTVECSEDISPAATGEPTVTGCGDISVTHIDADIVPSCGNAGAILRTWTADNGVGSPATCVQEITIVDTTPPTLTIPADVTIECDASSLPADIGSATAADACDDNPAITYADAETVGACAGQAVITRTWTATDACGNAASADQIITIVDTTAPVLNIPTDVTVQCGDETSPATTGDATAVDNCDPDPAITYDDEVVDGACSGTATITRTWTAADACGNIVSAAQTINVVDTIAPTLTVPDTTTIGCDMTAVPGFTGEATAVDTCDPAPAITYSDEIVDGACIGNATITRTWTATDACGNAASGVQIINVVDQVAPEMTIPDSITLPCGTDSSPAVAGAATAIDGCDPAPVIGYADTTVVGSCDGETIITRTWTATDSCGNAVNADQLITMVDAVAPTLTAPADVTLDCGADTSPASTGSATAIDDCGTPAVMYSDEELAGTCAGESTIMRTWTAVDGCSNSSIAVQIITLTDDAPPVLALPADVTINCDDDPAPTGTGSAAATDACDPAPAVTYSDVIAPGGAGESVITRTWTAADECGNAVIGEQIITISDVVPPVLTIPADALLTCGDDTTPAATGHATAVDNCDSNPIVAWSDATAAGSCASEVVITRTWTATDSFGNSAEGVQIITLTDDEPPVLIVDTDPIYVTDVDCDGVEHVTLPAATATDNCPAPVTVTNDAPASFAAGTTTIVTFTATDGCGNAVSEEVEVTVGYGSAIRVFTKKYTLGWGCRPWIHCEPLDDITIAAFDFSCGSCARYYYMQQWCCMRQALPRIFSHCDPVATGVTNQCGVTLLDVPPGDYLVAAYFDDNGDGAPDTYLGNLTFNVHCGETRIERLYLVKVANGKHMGCNWHYFFGSELIVVEPQDMLWDGTEQLYPFVFDTEGDWDVDVSITPPDGFLSDYDHLDDTVVSELKALQFTVTEIGSDLIPTASHFKINHQGRSHIFDSAIDIMLTPDYARSRGFNVEALRQRGLIIEDESKPTDRNRRSQTNVEPDAGEATLDK